MVFSKCVKRYKKLVISQIQLFACVHGSEHEHFRDYKAVLKRFKAFQSVSERFRSYLPGWHKNKEPRTSCTSHRVIILHLTGLYNNWKLFCLLYRLAQHQRAYGYIGAAINNNSAAIGFIYLVWVEC